MNIITRENLQSRLEEATVSLLFMARDASWNKVSDNCFYIISEEDTSSSDSRSQYKLRKSTNDKKTPEPLSALKPIINGLYSDTYEFDLYIYKAQRNKTIIEITHRPKDYYDFHPEFKERIKDNPPGLHCKVAIPNYASNISGKNKKFNINWPLNPIDHRLKAFWYRLRYKYNKYIRKIYG